MNDKPKPSISPANDPSAEQAGNGSEPGGLQQAGAELFDRLEKSEHRRKQRCPYCIDGETFRKLTSIGDLLRCESCGHVEWPFNPKFLCDCARCQRDQLPRSRGRSD